MTEYEQKLAKINKAELGPEHYCRFGFNIDLDYGNGSGQGTGWYGVDSVEILRRIMLACGVGRWNNLPGRTVYALIDADGMVKGFQPLPTEHGEAVIFEEVYNGVE